MEGIISTFDRNWVSDPLHSIFSMEQVAPVWANIAVLLRYRIMKFLASVIS